jgi:hypothetical protein
MSNRHDRALSIESDMPPMPCSYTSSRSLPRACSNDEPRLDVEASREILMRRLEVLAVAMHRLAELCPNTFSSTTPDLSPAAPLNVGYLQ